MGYFETAEKKLSLLLLLKEGRIVRDVLSGLSHSRWGGYVVPGVDGANP